MNDQLVWIDCEMTGLDLARDALIEIACIVTDGQLNVADEGIDLVIKPPAEALDHMPEVVREMHTASGLLTELASGITLAEAQEQVLAYVRSHVREPRKVPLCGNSIATDRTFIARDMPELDAFLHYRMVDVSSIKELARRWYPRVYFASPEKHGGHRGWPTSGRASGSCSTTGRRSSCRSRGRIPPPRGRSQPGTGRPALPVPPPRPAMQHSQPPTRPPRPANPVLTDALIPVCFGKPRGRSVGPRRWWA